MAGRPDAPVGDVAVNDSVSGRRRLRTLVVDDHDDVRLVVRVGLEQDDRFGEIDEATNGREAIDAAGVSPPDVILLDEMMPVMSGMEALPILRQVAPRARIVLFSAVADQLDLVGEHRPDAVLAKGDLGDLFDVLAGATADTLSR